MIRSHDPRTRRTPTILAALGALAAAPLAHGQPQLPDGFVDERVATRMSLSACMALLPDGRVLVTQQKNFLILLIKPETGAVEVAGRVDSVYYFPEHGLLGIAVDPRWPVKPYIYVHYSYTLNERIHISRFAMTGDLDGSLNGTLTVDSLSKYHVIVDIPNATPNHAGGQLHFGPDGTLYASLGDDLYSCEAQSREILRGKIIRLKVLDLPDGPGGPPPLADITPADNPFAAHPDPSARLVWAYGLRNPYSFTIDPPTGRVVIADVGSAGWEELDLATAPGLNFGWPLYEGFAPFRTCANADTMGIPPERPIYVYARPSPEAPVSVISGGVYRRVPGGPASFPPQYEGNIFVSDVYQGFLRRLVPDGAQWRLADSVPGQPSATDWGRDYDGVTDYTVGPDGALWYAKYAEDYWLETGEIRRIRWVGGISLVPPGPGAPLRLEAPAPSPARTSARLAWTQERDDQVSLEAYDVRGALVRRVAPLSFRLAGAHALTWDLTDESGRALPPGLYFVRLSARAGGTAVRRLVLVR